MSRIKIALAQFFVKEAGEENLAVVKDLIARADEAGASLLVLPEGIIARKPGVAGWPKDHAESLDGPFVTGLLKATEGRGIAVACTVHVKVPGEERVHNDLIVARGGRLELVYTKLHLYDAFNAK